MEKWVDVMYRPKRSIEAHYRKVPKEKWHNNALDGWIRCLTRIPMCKNPHIGGRVSCRVERKILLKDGWFKLLQKIGYPGGGVIWLRAVDRKEKRERNLKGGNFGLIYRFGRGFKGGAGVYLFLFKYL